MPADRYISLSQFGASESTTRRATAGYYPPMRFGLQLFQDPAAANLWDDLAAKARIAEESGFDSVWLWDHLMFDRTFGQSDWNPTLECFVALGAVAAVTSRVKI